MSRIKKLIQKALNSPQNLTFQELCKLCESFGLVCRDITGSHHQYKRMEKPRFTQTITNVDGKAKAYQVRQLMERIKRYGLMEEDNE